jgi:hypothetical protein
LYLLHGAYGLTWLAVSPNKTLIQQLSDQYNIIIVMPEAFGFYLDSQLIKSQFETYITSGGT